MSTHYLKCWPQYFKAVACGDKRFELRLNDREFNVGDTLVLEEYDQESGHYSGRAVQTKVIYMVEDTRFLRPNYVAMGIGPVTPCGEAFDSPPPKNSSEPKP